jgi:hypothetical protein
MQRNWKRKSNTFDRIQLNRGWKIAPAVIGVVPEGDRRLKPVATKTTEIYNWFTEGFELSDLKEAKALLEELRATAK